jgi:ABC-type nitrate/sulfonate/bicarbonate transport system permease component
MAIVSAGSRAPAVAAGESRAPAVSRRLRTLAIQCGCILVLLGAWQLTVVLGAVPDTALARPTDVMRALTNLAERREFWAAIGDTVHTWVIGLALSMLIAVPLGLLLGGSHVLYRMFRVPIDFLRTIPPVALLPLALLLYGARETTALLLVVFGSVWPLLIQAMYGAHQVDPISRQVARAYRLRRRDLVRSVVAPSAAPLIATGIRIAATMSLVLAVGAELLGAVPGIGAQIAANETSAQRIPAMYAYVVAATALGVILNLVLVRLERRLLEWHRARR